jgi:hypothetical protein
MGGSEVTGATDGELFAWSFSPQHIPNHRLAMNRVISERNRGLISRSSGWEHLRAMSGNKNLIDHVPSYLMRDTHREGWEWTEDFDYPHNYDEWLRRRTVFLGEDLPDNGDLAAE